MQRPRFTARAQTQALGNLSQPLAARRPTRCLSLLLSDNLKLGLTRRTIASVGYGMECCYD
jgi:hypothetical protein